MRMFIALPTLFVISGCANVDFKANNKGAVYYEPLPYLFYTVTDKCVSSATVVSLPGEKRYLDFTWGYGSSNLSAEFSNGLLTKVGQTSDTKIPETITSITALAAAVAKREEDSPACSQKAILYPIENGIPNLNKPYTLGQ